MEINGDKEPCSTEQQSLQVCLRNSIPLIASPRAHQEARHLDFSRSQPLILRQHQALQTPVAQAFPMLSPAHDSDPELPTPPADFVSKAAMPQVRHTSLLSPAFMTYQTLMFHFSCLSKAPILLALSRRQQPAGLGKALKICPGLGKARKFCPLYHSVHKLLGLARLSNVAHGLARLANCARLSKALQPAGLGKALKYCSGLSKARKYCSGLGKARKYCSL